MERRLAAILAADVVGYSRLMEADEAGTLARLEGLKAEILVPLIAEHHGRIIKQMGDGLLIEFSSVVDAVACAVAWQSAAEMRSGQVPEDRAMRFRIGVNLGDVIIKDDDVYGEGVNLAARLEGLAKPGTVLVSQTVADHAKGKVPVRFDDLGEKHLKNLTEPVRVYQVETESESLGTSKVAKPLKNSRRVPGIAAVVAAVIAGAGAVFWIWPEGPREEPASVERMAFPLPDRPSIAVLPFNNISDDQGQEYFADGIAENLITDLSKIAGLFVISRNSSFTYKGQPIKIRQVAEDLGVRYVLEGSIQRAGDTVRINAQLIDAMTGGHVWAERYDGSMTDVFGLQDQITGNIVRALAPKLMPDWEKQSERRESSSPEAFDSFLRGWNHYIRWTPEDFADAIPYFEHAIELDPAYGRPYAALASIYWEGGVQRYWYDELGVFWGEAKTRAKENLELALQHPTPLAYRVAALANLDGFSSDYDSAEDEAQKAIALDPNDPEGHITLAHVLTMAGKPTEAISFIETAMRLDPNYPPHYTFELALAHFTQGEFEKTAELLEEAIARNPKDFFPYFLLVPTYAHLGQENDTAATIERLTAVLPTDYSKAYYYLFWAAFEKREHHELMVEGRKKANAYSYMSR